MQGTYRIARWTDERGESVVAGLVESEQPFVILSLSGAGRVEIPSGAVLYAPAKPEMRRVGEVA